MPSYQQKPMLGALPMWGPNVAGIPAPVGAYVFNEHRGDWAADTSNNGNDGTLVSGNVPDWIADYLDFNGSGDRIDCGNFATLNGHPILSVVCGLSPDGYGEDGFGRIFHKGTAANGIEVHMRNTGGESIRINYDAATDYLWDLDPGLFTFGNPFVFGFTLDTNNPGTDPQMYIDGNSVGVTTTAGAGAGSALPNDFVIGDNSGLNRSYDGKMYWMLVYNQLLTAAQHQFIAMNPFYAWDYLNDELIAILAAQGAAPSGRIMSSLVAAGGLAGMGGIAGQGGGLAG